MGATTVEIPSNHVAMVSHHDDVLQLIETAAEAVQAANWSLGRADLKFPSVVTATRPRDRDCTPSADMADGFGRARSLPGCTAWDGEVPQPQVVSGASAGLSRQQEGALGGSSS